jgi:FkbM family methyltransferase
MNNPLTSFVLQIYYAFLYVKCKTFGLDFKRPNYAFFKKFLTDGITVDVGVGDKPDFSLLLMKEYHLEAYIVDPTLKHKHTLEVFENEHPSAHYLSYALGEKSESRVFYESQSNVSGSLCKDHVNVKSDPVVSYDVQVITLNQLLQKCGNKIIAIMKVDIEGEEYNFVKSLTKRDLLQINQLLIEFHHDTVSTYTMKDTLSAIKTVEAFGMKSIVYNGRDCIFYWEKMKRRE